MGENLMSLMNRTGGGYSKFGAGTTMIKSGLTNPYQTDDNALINHWDADSTYGGVVDRTLKDLVGNIDLTLDVNTVVGTNYLDNTTRPRSHSLAYATGSIPLLASYELVFKTYNTYGCVCADFGGLEILSQFGASTFALTTGWVASGNINNSNVLSANTDVQSLYIGSPWTADATVDVNGTEPGRNVSGGVYSHNNTGLVRFGSTNNKTEKEGDWGYMEMRFFSCRAYNRLLTAEERAARLALDKTRFGIT